MIVELWGAEGKHARSAPGQGPAPLNVPIIVDAIVVVARFDLGGGRTPAAAKRVPA